MKIVLYFIYAGFLVGTFSLGNIVADITTQSKDLRTDTSTSNNQELEAFAGPDITKLLSDYLQSARGILTVSFILSAVGMISIAVLCIRSRDTKIKKIDKLIEDHRPKGDTQLSEDEILKLEEKILILFPFKT
jgi:hypothetical protein